MKLKFLPLLLTTALPLAALADGPIDGDIYGKINLTLDMYEESYDNIAGNDFDEWQLNSNASRFGVKGKTALTDSLNAIYQFEWEVNTDGDGTDLKARNRYIGLQGGFGKIIGGKHDTPTKLAQKKIDLFNDLYGDIKNTFEGENRLNDIVMYSTPSMGGFTVTAAFIPGEDGAADGDDGLADGKSLSFDYSIDNIYLALAVDRDIDGLDLERIVGQFTFGAFTLGAMVQQAEQTNGNLEEQGVFVSGAFKFGDNALKAQFGTNDKEAGSTDSEEQTISLGYDRKLAKSTKAFAYITANVDTDNANDEAEQTVFGVGLEHKF
ncbi:MAG: porin [Cellvibrionaceae bacterium]